MHHAFFCVTKALWINLKHKQENERKFLPYIDCNYLSIFYALIKTHVAAGPIVCWSGVRSRLVASRRKSLSLKEDRERKRSLIRIPDISGRGCDGWSCSSCLWPWVKLANGLQQVWSQNRDRPLEEIIELSSHSTPEAQTSVSLVRWYFFLRFYPFWDGLSVTSTFWFIPPSRRSQTFRSQDSLTLLKTTEEPQDICFRGLTTSLFSVLEIVISNY